jgi:hypothetical protein
MPNFRRQWPPMKGSRDQRDEIGVILTVTRPAPRGYGP